MQTGRVWARGRALSIAFSALGAAACGQGEEIVVKGPGLLPELSPATLAVGGTTVARVGWAASGTAPVLRLRWTIGDTMVARVDSVAADTRTAYLSGRSAGTTSLTISDPAVQTVVMTLTVR